MKPFCKNICVAALLSLSLPATIFSQQKQASFCNPLNLPYNFQKADGPVRREAADPVIIQHLDRYWLFASKQAGYWFSDDLLNWNFVRPEGLPLSEYAPSVVIVNGKMHYTSSGKSGTFTTDDPFKGVWINIGGYNPGNADPAAFLDDDGRLFLYDGCSDQKPLQVTELDRRHFTPLTFGAPIVYADPRNHGWEVKSEQNIDPQPGDTTNKKILPWIEGAFMNKIKGRYYLQYAAPGTEFKVYGDGVYTSDKPEGPFQYAPYSPFSFKPTGFIAGAGHSSTFQGPYGNYWHIATATISVRHPFERRLSLFPTAVLKDGQLVTNTYLGDYPQWAPIDSTRSWQGNLVGWMLLSYRKPATASSVLAAQPNQTFDVKNAFDEDIRTWWSAQSGNGTEWLQVDLLQPCTIHAVQVNFADQDIREVNEPYADSYRYVVETSSDGKQWDIVIDRSNEKRDMPHDYIELSQSVTARYVRISNRHFPASGLFSIYDLRIFGKAPGKKPAQVSELSVRRDSADARTAHLQWAPAANADFYIVRYGLSPDRLFGNYQVYDATSISIHSLNKNVDYYFTVDAINGAGITRGGKPRNKIAGVVK